MDLVDFTPLSLVMTSHLTWLLSNFTFTSLPCSEWHLVQLYQYRYVLSHFQCFELGQQLVLD